jgi:hypothetical protein
MLKRALFYSVMPIIQGFFLYLADFRTNKKKMKKQYALCLSLFILFTGISFAGTNTPLPSPCSVTITTKNVTCSGLCDGMAIANPAGGVAPYTYSWSSGGGNTDTVLNICVGMTYNVTVTDNVGCTSTASTTITQPAALTVMLSANNSTCSCSGSLLGSANGGTASYSYSWSPSGGATASATSLCPGSYTLSVTDANACMTSAVGTITSSGGPISSVLTQKNVSCNTQCNGKVTVSTSGGSTPFTYSWSPGTSTSAVDSSLCAGTYTLTTTDAAGCHSAQNFTITQPVALTSAIVSHTNLKCNGQCNGKAMVTAAGGISPFTYSWTPTGGTRDSATNLCSGTSTVTVMDQNGCKSVDSVNLTEPASLVITPAHQNVTCNGGNNGWATAIVSGGTGPYTYTWLPSLIPFGLKAGFEACFVTDSNGCRIQSIFNITQPTKIVPVVSVKPVSCATCTDGRDSVNVTGGKLPYTYAWTPGGCTSPLCTGLAAGTYTCCVTDSAGCMICQTVSVGVLGITEMDAPSMYIYPNPAGDQLSIQIPPQYDIRGLGLFNTMGQQILELKDFRSSTLDVSMLKPGTYLLRLYYTGGCMHKLFIKK